MDRKKFIQKSMLAFIGLTLAAKGNANTLFSGRIRQKNTVGAHVWVYASSQPGYDVSPILNQIFSDMAYAGFDGVETMEHPLRSNLYTKQIGELIDQYKIKLIGSSYGARFWDKDRFNQIYEDVDKIFTNMTTVGGKTFGITVGAPAGRAKTDAEFENQANLLRKLITLGKSRGIVLNLHNHTGEVENNMFDLKGTLKRIPDIKLGPDLNWLLRAGIDPIKFLNEFKEQIVFLHLRDQYTNGKWPESMGEGNVNFIEIADTLRKINFDGEVIIELAHEKDFIPTRPLKESLKMSRDFMRKTMRI
jgi:sugar phosphate isomerase/epimerase